jgi:hypothetical protein
MDTFRKSPRQSNLNYESSSLLIRWLKSYTNISMQRFTHKNMREKLKLLLEPKPAETTRTGGLWESPLLAPDFIEGRAGRAQQCLDWRIRDTAKSVERAAEKWLKAGPCYEQKNEATEAHRVFTTENKAWPTEQRTRSVAGNCCSVSSDTQTKSGQSLHIAAETKTQQGKEESSG